MRHLPLRYLDLEIGDVIRFERLLWRITELTQGAVLELSAVRHQQQIFGAYKTLEEEADTASGSGQIARPELWLFELPAPALRHRLAVETDRGWEIIQFARAELIGERLYRLSYLLRGQFGSDGIGDARAGARCIILGAAQTPLAASPDHVPQSLAFRFGPPNLPQDGYGWQGGRYDMRRTALACLSPVHARLDWPRGFDDEWRISWTRRSRFGGDDFAAATIPLGEAREAYRLTLSADEAHVAQWQSETHETVLEAQQRRTYRTGRANAQNWRLAIQQINDRGEAGAPLFLPLPMNEPR